MEDIISISISLGLVTSMFFSEVLGIAAGGMVVPGYIAIYLDKPFVVLLTLFIAYATYFVVHSLSAFMVIYGRRRTVLMILVGFLGGWLVRTIGGLQLELGQLDLTVVGYIIPGLIAIWLDRQGTIETFSALITASVVVRLGLIVINFGEILQ